MLALYITALLLKYKRIISPLSEAMLDLFIYHGSFLLYIDFMRS